MRLMGEAMDWLCVQRQLGNCSVEEGLSYICVGGGSGASISEAMSISTKLFDLQLISHTAVCHDAPRCDCRRYYSIQCQVIEKRIYLLQRLRSWRLLIL